MRILRTDDFLYEKMRIVPLSDEDFNNIPDDMYVLHPETKENLARIIGERMRKDGLECDLNDIDVSKITDMSELFSRIDFNGDISGWDVSNVENMDCMFAGAYQFNCDISKWDVSKVKNMDNMFFRAYSFNCDISGWNVSNVKNMTNIFYECPLHKQPNKQPEFNKQKS